MDLRKFPRSGNIDEQELLSLWWYQPYIFADDIVSGVAPSWFIKGSIAQSSSGLIIHTSSNDSGT